MLNTLIVVLTLTFSIAGLVFAAWSYFDTKSKYAHQEFLLQSKIDHKEAQERFKKRARLGKRD